ncbi:YjbF family lipoprotein [Aliidiomarina maris]|uniref:Group 4 capsule polysaccharide lipoprotein GfcB/YjbF n=1 Tax=Aliidiomarina maris TaxID=531312 RepID=A0A327WRZ7_9GAMM|nr:YjbF family lipoprotein [Aliidiomarina maris]RAJ93616.1 group 4 capsule polysaccharide lipoprotein GfcB/YjbF [Aliidiomarina maris]RUO19070.1 hypothetical protein CWE07_13235 [Aliidiomarina maris]
MTAKLFRFAAGALCAPLLLTACTSVFGDVKETWQYATAPKVDAELSPERIANLPYTGIYVRRGDLPRAFVVLGFIDGEVPAERWQWVTANREVLETQNGRVVRTFDIAPELTGVSNLSEDPLWCLQQQMQQQRSTASCQQPWLHQIDMRDDDARYTLQLTSTFRQGEAESIELPTRFAQTVRWVEHVEVVSARRGMPREYINEYWLEDDGHIVKSIQHFVPGQAPIEWLEVKWIGRDDA